MTRPRVERRYGALVLVLEGTEYVIRQDAARLLLQAEQIAEVRVLGGPKEPVGTAYPTTDGRTIVFDLAGIEFHFGAVHLRALAVLPTGAAARAIAGAEA
jgi:hypothetical protein